MIISKPYFDDHLDEYLDHYHVYLMPELTVADLQGSWVDLPIKCRRDLGAIAIDQIRFDSTLRSTIDSAVLDRLIEQHRLA